MLQKRDVLSVLRRNGHLVVTGEENLDELREAAMHLRMSHTVSKCQMPWLGIPIETLIPDIRALTPKHIRTARNVRTVATSKERL